MKDPIKIRQATHMENIFRFAKEMLDKIQLPKIHKQLLKIKNKQKNDSVKK